MKKVKDPKKPHGWGMGHENPAANVDDYLKRQTPKVRAALKKIRKAVLDAAPMAQERISYGIPFYKYRGQLVGFAAHAKHLSFYVNLGVQSRFAKDLAGFEVSGSTIHFSVERPLPADLVMKLVRAKIEDREFNEIQRRREA
jgi:uncharacterized protein YdhG (YjbR/CyaY superfamily)